MNQDCLLSILVPTLVSRQAMFERLRQGLQQQIDQAGATQAVELLSLCDDGSLAVGDKRNQLMDRARGRFLVFVDDDDRVSDHYVASILAAIRQHPDVDCICCAGEIRFRGRHPRRMEHSLACTEWGLSDGCYRRPPSHITPLRADIARRYRFAAIDYSEDMDWAMRICHDGALKAEVVIDQALYFYDSRRHYAWQWLLDSTQAARHALGLRLVNRLALMRRFKSLLGPTQ